VIRAACASLPPVILITSISFALAQSPFKPELVLTISGEEAVLAAAFSSQDQIAYAIQKTIERGELWARGAEVYVVSLDGKEKKRILRADRFRELRTGRILSFQIDRLVFSPDATKLAIELTPRQGATAVFFYKSTGGEISLRGQGNFAAGYGVAWLGDNNSVGMLEEAAPPRLLHRIFVVRLEAGRFVPLFRPRLFAAVAWLAQEMEAVLVERDESFSQPPTLVRGNLVSGSVTPLGTEPDYLGGLRATGDEEGYSYFAGQNKLVRRKLNGEVAATMAIPFSHYEWLGTSGALAYLEPEKPGMQTGWLALWDPQRTEGTRLLPDERIKNFWVAPDGKHVAVLTAEEIPVLKVYRLPVQ